MLLCLSHRQTLVALDELGSNHDAVVKQWQASIAGFLSSEVSCPEHPMLLKLMM